MQTVLISVITSTVVTLLIEYFAKPSLEARKERLLSEARARREFMEASTLLKSSLMDLSTVVAVPDFAATGTKYEVEFDTYTQEVFRSFVRLRLTLPEELIPSIEAMLHVVEHDRSVIKILLTQPEDDNAEYIGESTYRIVRVLNTLETAFSRRRLIMSYRRRFYAGYIAEQAQEFTREVE